ncbi:hypothetical protein C1646_748993 [Rhizophagus diaphanus]|nr:hypothetical protein C1646_748993 [Rhizophagus diaphanus] [Rhizophagus sp. MUCL 43196]
MFSNSLMQVPTVPTATKDVESFTQPPSQQPSINNKNEKHVTKSKYRMRICDAPPELLELIRRSEIKNEQTLQNKSCVSNVALKNGSTQNNLNSHSYYGGYTPSKDLIRDDSPMTSSKSSSINYSSSSVKYISYTLPSPKNRTDKTKTKITSKKEAKKFKIKAKTKQASSKKQILYKKRGKGNSFYRAMTNSGITPTVVAEEAKPTRIPIPPSMKIEDLMKKIAQLNLDQDILEHITPNITWKGNPLFIGNLIHRNLLHPKEALVVSTLRLTPLQYLTSKYILISSARGYSQRSFPFRKSDAQRHLPIDVNKSSKLWEWFTQTGWLKTNFEFVS